jgi:hypothetical protein
MAGTAAKQVSLVNGDRIERRGIILTFRRRTATVPSQQVRWSVVRGRLSPARVRRGFSEPPADDLGIDIRLKTDSYGYHSVRRTAHRGRKKGTRRLRRREPHSRSYERRVIPLARTVLDAVLLLPDQVRKEAVAIGRHLADRMATAGNASHFRLDKPFPDAGDAGDAGRCEPHISLFMLTVNSSEIPGVAAALSHVATRIPPLSAEGAEYGHNPYGAPELYFRTSELWTMLQRSVVAAVEPLRRGRLREVDPAGENLRDVISNANPPDPVRVRQLTAYGYDEVTDDLDDRFKPHVTLAWPERREPRVDLGGLPPASVFSDTLTHVALYGMSPWGTCTHAHGVFALTQPKSAPAPA